MAEPEPGRRTWKKSTASANNPQCVEVAFAGQSVLVRNSRQPDGPMLSFTVPEWIAFLIGVGNGEFEPEG